MSIVIRGGKPLKGTVRCDGAKNAALPIMAGAILSEDISIIENVPRLRDVETMAHMLRALGVSVRIAGSSVRINPGKALHHEAPYDLVRMMRACLVMGPCLSAWGEHLYRFPEAALSDRGRSTFTSRAFRLWGLR